MTRLPGQLAFNFDDESVGENPRRWCCRCPCVCYPHSAGASRPALGFTATRQRAYTTGGGRRLSAGAEGHAFHVRARRSSSTIAQFANGWSGVRRAGSIGRFPSR